MLVPTPALLRGSAASRSVHLPEATGVPSLKPVKTGLGHLLAILLLVQCGPGGLKSDPASNPSGGTSTSAGASKLSAVDSERSGADSEPPPLPKVVPGSPIVSGPAEADPRLVVRNAYQKPQYVFLESRLLGSVDSGAQGSFAIPPGAHSVTFSDSRDGRSNRKTLAEVFDSGYAYHYDVLAH